MTDKKGAGRRERTPREEKAHIDKLLAIEALRVRSERIFEIKRKSLSAQEMCMVAVASELLELRHDLHLSWRALATELGGCIDYTTLYKLAARRIWISGNHYKILAMAINSYRRNLGKKEIDFPQWQ